MKRAIFYLCSTITNSVKKGKGGDFDFPRVYSLNFLNFDLDFGDGCNDIVQYVSLSNEEQQDVRYDYMHLVFVMLPRFNKSVDRCETLQDKLLYSLRHIHELREKPKQFKGRLFSKLFGIAEFSNFTDMEYSDYMSRFMARADRKAQMAYAKEEGLAQGISQGIAKGISQIAKSMLQAGESVAKIAKYTKLSKKEILSLK